MPADAWKLAALTTLKVAVNAAAILVDVAPTKARTQGAILDHFAAVRAAAVAKSENDDVPAAEAKGSADAVATLDAAKTTYDNAKAPEGEAAAARASGVFRCCAQAFMLTYNSALITPATFMI